MTRTRVQNWKLDRLADRISLRELAQEVECQDCGAAIGDPCVHPDGVPLAKVDHPRRIRKAERARAERTRS